MRRTIRSNNLIIAANQNLKEKEYWLNQLSGEWEKNYFPYDYKKDANQRRWKDMNFRFHKELFSALMALCKNSLYKLHITLSAALTAFINKYTGSEDVVIGTPIYKQKKEGDFVNTVLVLRNQVDNNITFRELILNMKDVIVKGMENQNYPVEILSHQLDIPFSRDDDFPLFDIAILLENIHDKSYIKHINCNIIFSFLKSDQYIEGTMEYNSCLYEEITIGRIIDYFSHFLQEAVLKVNLKLSSSGILSKNGKQQILFEFNQTKKSIVRDKCYHQLFQEVVKRKPLKTAAINEDQHISYSELNQKAGRIAGFLSEQGVKPNVIVALYLKRSINMLVSIIGVFKAGGAYLPIDVDWPETRLRYVLENSEADIVITDREHLEILHQIQIQAHSPGFNHILCLDHEKGLEKPVQGTGVKKPEENNHPNILAYMIYTSGTTGRPKGVLIHQLAMLNHIYAKINDLSINENDIIAQTASAGFDISVWQFLAGLLVGGRILVIHKEIVLELRKFLKVLQEEKVTIVESVPSLMWAFLKNAAHESNNALTHLRWMISTGEPLGVPLVRDWYSLYPHIMLLNAYGPTEAADDITHYVANKIIHDHQETIPIGKPVQNLHIYILDKNMSLCPIGVRGEICVAGIGVGKGYWKDHQKTEKAFLTNPFLDEIGDNDFSTLYKTGDIGYFREDGNIECIGRTDDQVKIRGNRVELREIEKQLLKHEDVMNAVVAIKDTGNTSDPNPEADNKKLCCYVVADKDIDIAELREYLIDKLPDYMIPSHFMQIKRIPLTANGKVDRKALPPPRIKAGKNFIPPQNEIEYKLTEIWSEILDIERENLGVTDNFFQLGGHSLKATLLVSRIHRELAVKLPLVEIFKTQTIRKLSESIKGSAKVRYTSIEPTEEKEYYALSPTQKRLYILQQMDLESTAYNISQIVGLQGKLSLKRFKQVFQQLIERHESFRTSFWLFEDEPIQRISPQVELDVEYYEAGNEGNSGANPPAPRDFMHMPDVAPIANHFMRPFDLCQPPLLRLGWIKVAQTYHILMVDMHHIISDGVSLRILIQDMASLYQGEELSPLRLQYKDFSKWQNKILNSEKVKRQERYWLNRFKGHIPVLKIPTDYPRKRLQSFAGEDLDFEIDEKLTNQFKTMTAKYETTSYMALLAIFSILLSKYTQQDDIIIGSPIAGRRHGDLNNVVGMFINILLMRSFPVPGKTFAEFLHEVKTINLEAFENQDYQFDDLMAHLDVNRGTEKNPLYSVIFALLNMEIPKIHLPGLKIEHGAIAKITAKTELRLGAIETENTIMMKLTYVTALFKRETVEEMAGHYIEILEQVVKDNRIKLKDIKISHRVLSLKPNVLRSHEVAFSF